MATALPAHAARPKVPTGIIGVKIVVKDAQKAIDFYSKLGLKVGVKYNAWEQEMLPESGQGPRLILILNEAAPTKREAGGSSLMIHVSDVRATAKALKDSGYPDVGEPRSTPRSVGLVVKDPDGDDVELLSEPSPK